MLNIVQICQQHNCHITYMPYAYFGNQRINILLYSCFFLSLSTSVVKLSKPMITEYYLIVPAAIYLTIIFHLCTNAFTYFTQQLHSVPPLAIIWCISTSLSILSFQSVFASVTTHKTRNTVTTVQPARQTFCNRCCIVLEMV